MSSQSIPVIVSDTQQGMNIHKAGFLGVNF